VGQSTKTGARGYIGEKGIGFKSVFKIARRVHVQSGPYSFAFNYDRNLSDSGLGMITPLHADYLTLPGDVRTRMVLSLKDGCDIEHLIHEFDSLPDTFLIFLKKLTKISIKIKREGEEAKETVYTKCTNGNRVTITKTVGEVEDHFHFWVARQEVEDMPKNDKRLIKRKEEPDEWITTAEVVLALPLDENDVPIVEPQHVFAFLPLRKVGLQVRFRCRKVSRLIKGFSSSFKQILSPKQTGRTFTNQSGTRDYSRRSWHYLSRS
jgi:hypothetical protein